MPIIYIQGKVDVTQFEQTCQRQHPTLDPKNVVFLFPGNSGHHGEGVTLYTIKSGGGLAVPAGQLGGKGYPVLSLPTTTMERWSTDSHQKSIVEGAIADLYRAIGAGYSLMLPIRTHENTQYFERGLKEHGGSVEPSFWGGFQPSANIPLANHYITALDNLADFIALPDEEKQRQALADSTNAYYAAYLNGLQMQDNDPWLKPIIKSAPSIPKPIEPPQKPVTPQPTQAFLPDEPPQHPTIPLKTETTPDHKLEERPTPPAQQPSLIEEPPLNTKRPTPLKRRPEQSKKTSNKAFDLPIPTSYTKLYQQDEDPLWGARALLNDYTKSNSACLRFFYGHWNRHHVKDIAEIVNQIDEGRITSSKQLINKLNSITLVNPSGSLARRIQFLEEQFNTDKKDEAATQSVEMKRR